MWTSLVATWLLVVWCLVCSGDDDAHGQATSPRLGYTHAYIGDASVTKVPQSGIPPWPGTGDEFHTSFCSKGLPLEYKFDSASDVMKPQFDSHIGDSYAIITQTKYSGAGSLAITGPGTNGPVKFVEFTPLQTKWHMRGSNTGAYPTTGEFRVTYKPGLSPSPVNQRRIFYAVSFRNSQMQVSHGIGTNDDIIQCTALSTTASNTWYSVEVVLDYTHHTTVVHIDGAQKCSFRWPRALVELHPTANGIWLMNTGAMSTTYFDEVCNLWNPSPYYPHTQ